MSAVCGNFYNFPEIRGYTIEIIGLNKKYMWAIHKSNDLFTTIAASNWGIFDNIKEAEQLAIQYIKTQLKYNTNVIGFENFKMKK